VITQDPRHLPAARTQPKTELWQLVLGFWPQPPPPLTFREPTTPPLSLPHTCRPTISPYRPPSLFPTPRPKPSSSSSGSRFAPNRLPGSRFANMPPHHRHCLVSATAAPPRIIPCCQFQRRALNRAPAARGCIFHPNCLPGSRFTNAQPHHRRCLVHAAPPSPAILPCRRFQHRTRNRALAARGWVFPPNRLPGLRFVNAPPYHRHCLVRATAAPPCTVPHCQFQRRAPNKAPAAGVGIFTPIASLARVSQTRHPTTSAALYVPPHHCRPTIPLCRF
jgi:hypothetical protein